MKAQNLNLSRRVAQLAPVALALAVVAVPAQAYVGPGAGLSLLSALWALVAAIFAAVAFIVMWPVRKMLKQRKAAANNGNDNSATNDKQAP